MKLKNQLRFFPEHLQTKITYKFLEEISFFFSKMFFSCLLKFYI